MKTLALIALVLLTGCATQQSVWNKPGASNMDFDMDQGRCQAQAYAMGSAMQIALVYNACMRGNGWYLTTVR